MTSGEHQLDHMGDDRGRVEIVETAPPVESGQPWHVRYVAANSEPLAVAENLSSEQAAETNVLAMARLFGATDPVIVRSGETGRAVVLGGRRAVEMRYVDERGSAVSS